MYEEAVAPCPRCNPDSGFEPGEYQAELIARFGKVKNEKALLQPAREAKLR